MGGGERNCHRIKVWARKKFYGCQTLPLKGLKSFIKLNREQQGSNK
jgi:hypothetical protein